LIGGNDRWRVCTVLAVFCRVPYHHKGYRAADNVPGMPTSSHRPAQWRSHISLMYSLHCT